MKIKYIVSILTLLVMVSCAKEDDIVTREPGMASKFEFPQGDSEWDRQLVAIHEKFGVKCIYKNITSDDLNKAWTGEVSTGDAGIKGEGLKDDEMVKFYTDFFVNHIFRHFDPKHTVGIFPPNIYFVYDYNKKTLNTAFGHPAFPNAKEYYDTKQERVYTGLDFWAFCFEGTNKYDMFGKESSFTRPTDALSFMKCKELIIKSIIEKMMKKGNIAEPKFFLPDVATDLDYKTPIVNGDKETADPNYYKNRGFVEVMRSTTIYAAPTVIYNTTIGGVSVVKITPAELYIDYVWLGVRYTKAEILKNYAVYPKVLKYYNLVEEYLRTNYNINLDEIAQKPVL